jgi:N-acylneuraminate cytidylyltransferase/CMP-N,N'-diacetyllegionaminic acid synthase
LFLDKKVLALIPARGASRGVPGKNTRSLGGKPLIAWTIETALQDEYTDRVVVSTNDEKIAVISEKYGADVPFMRPKELATDSARAIDVLLHTIEWLEKRDEIYDIALYLQPTAPLRSSVDIDRSLEMLAASKEAKIIVSVCEASFNPLFCNTLPPDKNMKHFLQPGMINKNRQELPTYYSLNGAIYSSDWDYIKRERSFFGERTFAYVMPRERSVDIDSELDFKIAELLL